MKYTVFVMLLLASSAQALVIRPEVNYQFFNKYEIANIENDFESSGLGGGLSFFSDTDELSMLRGEGTLGWITGFGFQYVALKTKSLNGAPLTLPESFDADVLKLQVILGASYLGWRLEIPISGVLLKEKTAPLQDDEKYGWGLGLTLLYALTDNFLMGLGFEHLSFAHGKNASTGNQGTLANDVSLSGPKLVLGYNFNWSTAL